MTEQDKRYTPKDALIRFGRICAGESVAPEPEANAHLIAAAPEMLEMLEEVALQIRRGQDISEWYSEIVDTIEKAKGEQV